MTTQFPLMDLQNLSSSDITKKRFESYNWNYLSIDGHNFEEIDQAIKEAKKVLYQQL